MTSNAQHTTTILMEQAAHVPACVSDTTLGLMQRGGTSTRVRMRSTGWEHSTDIPSRAMSSSAMQRNKWSTRSGFSISYIYTRTWVYVSAYSSYWTECLGQCFILGMEIWEKPTCLDVYCPRVIWPKNRRKLEKVEI